MKIILRDWVTGLYYGGNQTWIVGVSSATGFESIESAASVAKKQQQVTINVVLRYEDPKCELALPLAPYLFETTGDQTQGRHPPHPD